MDAAIGRLRLVAPQFAQYQDHDRHNFRFVVEKRCKGIARRAATALIQRQCLKERGVWLHLIAAQLIATEVS